MAGSVVGSQRQLRLYVDAGQVALDDAVERAFPKFPAGRLVWRSPRRTEDYREYGGTQFLRAVDLSNHREALRAFWPARGPQWDGLARTEMPTGSAGVLLVEAKSHVRELLKGTPVRSPRGTPNREVIERSLLWTREQLAATAPAGAWTGPLYQSANRLAHVTWLRSRGVAAWLLYLLFTDDPHAPTSASDWQAAMQSAHSQLGVTDRLPAFVGHVLLPSFDSLS